MALDPSFDILARWSGADPRHGALLREAGITAVWQASGGLAAACRDAGIQTPAADAIQFLGLDELDRAAPGAIAALRNGLWPGITREPNAGAAETASPSREPWVDANGYWIGYLRALYPDRPALLGYEPDLQDRVVPFDSLDLALIEAWVAGGNYVLSVEPRYRLALLAGEEKARSAWRQLGRTARWLREHVALFRRPPVPTITALVEKGPATAEVANLLCRRNASPALVAAASPPPPDPDRRLALVAANLAPPPAEMRARILAHAQAGSTVVLAGRPWWNNLPAPSRSEPDRDFHPLGRGQVVAYRKPVADPSEFALDVIDLVTHKRRAVRLWNAPACIARVTEAPPGGGKALLHVVNYGSPIDSESEVQARVQGRFDRATLLRPEAPPAPLKTARRGTTTEIFIRELVRLGVVVFE